MLTALEWGVVLSPVTEEETEARSGCWEAELRGLAGEHLLALNHLLLDAKHFAYSTLLPSGQSRDP